jgi:hypothetical protein
MAVPVAGGFKIEKVGMVGLGHITSDRHTIFTETVENVVEKIRDLLETTR